jgi:hypothetical protein
MLSPFEKHREILLEQSYSTAESLQQFVLSMYNSDNVQFRADKLTNYDTQHFAIFVELANSFHLHGENDPAFMQICREMWAQRKQWGREHLEQLTAHKAINPKAYDEGERGWHEHLEWLESRSTALRSKGWID